MGKIRLLHCLQTIDSGGVERRRLSLAKLLNTEEFILKIICTNVEGDFYNEFEKYGVEVLPVGVLKGPFDLTIHKKVQNIISNYKPHIIHGAVFEGVSMAAINGFLKKTPIVIIEETSDPQTRSWKANLLMNFFGNVADCAIGVSPVSVDYLLNKAKIKKNKVKLINNGVSIPRFVSENEKQELKTSLGINSKELIIGSVGRMLQDEQKRFSDLIKAFAEISKVNNNVKLLLVGEGPEQEEYRLLVEQLDISTKVIFTGYQEDTAKYYAIMDLFALVSAYEAFGLVLAEAMLQSLPVVATRVGGMKYIVEDGQTGFLVERYNIIDISDKLSLLIDNKQLRSDLGKAGYQRAIQNFTEEIYVESIESLYKQLAKRKNIL